MRKLILLLILIIVLLTAAPSFAQGIIVDSDNGDRVGIWNDVRVSMESIGNVVTVMGDIDINADVVGDVVAVFGDIDVNAAVKGQVVCIFGQIRLGENAEVGGDVVSFGSITKDQAAVVRGNIIRMDWQGLEQEMDFLMALRIAFIVLFSLLSLASGLIMIAFTAGKLDKLIDSSEVSIVQRVFIGFLAFIGASTLMLIFFVTLIIPFAYLLLVLFANIIAALYFGRLIVKAFKAVFNIYLEFVTGLITITLVKLLIIFLIPQSELVLSWLIYLAFEAFISSMGIGIFIYSKFGKTSDEKISNP